MLWGVYVWLSLHCWEDVHIFDTGLIDSCAMQIIEILQRGASTIQLFVCVCLVIKYIYIKYTCWYILSFVLFASPCSFMELVSSFGVGISGSQREAPELWPQHQRVAKDAAAGSATWALLCNHELRVWTNRVKGHNDLGGVKSFNYMWAVWSLFWAQGSTIIDYVIW